MEILEKWKTPSQQLDPWHPESFQPEPIQAIQKWLEENAIATEKDKNDSNNEEKPNAAPNSSPSEPDAQAVTIDAPLPEEIHNTSINGGQSTTIMLSCFSQRPFRYPMKKSHSRIQKVIVGQRVGGPRENKREICLLQFAGWGYYTFRTSRTIKEPSGI